ncbi:hypothetical protein MMC19_006638 [Ptychographa xylographoides]|nr:hypothetical protein [Ptychographa xylographoides]
MHFGCRTTDSSFDTFKQYLFRFNTLQTLVCYFFSAWWFSEVYIWSMTADTDLQWVAEGKLYERRRLNERPIYLRSFFFLLASTQSIIHIYCDYDHITLPIDTPKSENKSEKSPTMDSPIAKLKSVLPIMLRNAVTRAIATSLSGPFVYAGCIRWVAWPWTLWFARLVWSIPKESTPSRYPPMQVGLMIRSFAAGLMLLCLWEFSNAVFTAYVAQEPLKNGQPLTADSREPNGSLLNGLKSRKEGPKNFAFWELTIISHRYEARRKSIFNEIDRAKGATWTQILGICLGTIQDINTRISDFQSPASSASAQASQPKDPIQRLPQLSSPLKQDPILINPVSPQSNVERVEATAESIAKYYGQSPSSRSPLSPHVKEVINIAKDKFLTEEQQNAFTFTRLTSLFSDYFVQYLRTPVGYPFRQLFARRLSLVVLGNPTSQISIIINAVDSITNLAVASLKEDQYGTVNKDIPTILRTFVITVQNIERIRQQMPVHWTDTEFEERGGDGRKVKEVELVLSHLKSGIAQLIQTFGGYAQDMGLGPVEMRAARQAADLAG